MATYVYMRYSTDKQTEERQQHSIKEYCKKHSLTPDASFCDHARSGIVSFKNRRFAKELLDLLRPGDVLVVSDLDRLGRSALNVLDVIKELTTDKEVKLHVVNFAMQVVDVSSPIGLIIVTVMAALAEMERSLASSRARESAAARQALGTLTRRDAPIGYKLSGSGKGTFRKDRDQWRTMSLIITMYLAGASAQNIYVELSKDKRNQFNPYGQPKHWCYGRISEFIRLWERGLYPQLPFSAPDKSNEKARSFPWDGEESSGVGKPQEVLSDTEAALALRSASKLLRAYKGVRKKSGVRPSS